MIYVSKKLESKEFYHKGLEEKHEGHEGFRELASFVNFVKALCSLWLFIFYHKGHEEKHEGHEGFREDAYFVVQDVKLYFISNRKQDNF